MSACDVYQGDQYTFWLAITATAAVPFNEVMCVGTFTPGFAALPTFTISAIGNGYAHNGTYGGGVAMQATANTTANVLWTGDTALPAGTYMFNITAK